MNDEHHAEERWNIIQDLTRMNPIVGDRCFFCLRVDRAEHRDTCVWNRARRLTDNHRGRADRNTT